MSLHNFLYGIYPYIALTVFLLGSWLRFDREQYTWKSDSSQLLSKANMRLGSNLPYRYYCDLFRACRGFAYPAQCIQSTGGIRYGSPDDSYLGGFYIRRYVSGWRCDSLAAPHI